MNTTLQTPTPLRVVVVSGSVQHPSRTDALLRGITHALAQHLALDSQFIALAQIGADVGGVLRRAGATPTVEAALRSIETADVLLVGSPVYRASYTGLLKHLFDLVHHEALFDVPVLLAATGGSERHALMLDHPLRPLFAFFQAHALPVGLYASETDFTGHTLSSPAVQARIQLAVSRALPLLQPRGARLADAPFAASA